MARSRGNAGPLWKVAVYIRLSREDGRPDESESVANQRKLILEHLAALSDGG